MDKNQDLDSMLKDLVKQMTKGKNEAEVTKMALVDGATFDSMMKILGWAAEHEAGPEELTAKLEEVFVKIEAKEAEKAKAQDSFSA